MSRRGYSKATQKEDREFEAILGSIERSRKRNLSEGLLRGDQALDRLKEQEASASPHLKRQREATPPSPTEMSLTMVDFKAYMDQNTNKTLRDLQTSISKVDDSVKANSARLDRQEATIRQNQAGLSELREEIRRVKHSVGTMAPAEPRQPPALPSPGKRSDDEERAFLLARRSLRIWPINTDDPWRSTMNFLIQNLGLAGTITEDLIETVGPARVPSGPGVRDEVLLVLLEARTRDLIIGASAKLANFKDSDGRPTAGIRIEVPPFLIPNFRTLFRFGQSLRAKHGPGVSIVFNKSRCSFKERKISGNGFELVAAVGKVGKLARQVALLCVYLQPRIKAADLQQLNDLINSEIILLKSRSSPLIFIGGDLNRKSLAGAVEDFIDIKQINFEQPGEMPAWMSSTQTQRT